MAIFAEASLRAGGEVTYRAVCRRMLRTMPADPVIAGQVVRACTLLPDAVDDWGRLLRVAELAGGRAGVAAVLIRAGRPADALRVLGRPSDRQTRLLALLAAGRLPSGTAHAALGVIGLAGLGRPTLLPIVAYEPLPWDDWRGLIPAVREIAGATAAGDAGEGGSQGLSSSAPNMIGD